jgi:hypothetical protein
MVFDTVCTIADDYAGESRRFWQAN